MATTEFGAPERILSFLGYGNPAGLWFVGKEEGLGQMDDDDQRANLSARRRFDPVMDLQAAHLALRERGQACDLTKWLPRTQVWRWAAKISRAVSGASDWRNPERARDYIRHSLGRTNGHTFITNLSPIPEKGGSSGRPWRRQFEEALPSGMLDTLLVKRHQALKDLILAYKPTAIICHGKPRSAHRAFMLGDQPAPANEPRIEAYDPADGPPVFICPFLGVGQMRTEDAELLVKMLVDRGVKLQAV